MRRPRKNNEKTLRLAWLLGSVLPLATIAPVALAADPFAASVLACAAESDRGQRLDCYDRAVAGFTARLRDSKQESPVGGPPTNAPIGPASAGDRAGSETSGAAAAQATDKNTPANTSANNKASLPRHLTATVSSIDYFPNRLLVHLNNGQVWEQVAEASSELNLRVGDTVIIDKQMGSYWLSASKDSSSALQVKLKADKPAS